MRYPPTSDYDITPSKIVSSITSIYSIYVTCISTYIIVTYTRGG